MTSRSASGPPAPVAATIAGVGLAAEGGQATERTAETSAATLAEKLEGGRKIIESVIIAVVTSTGVFLVGSIYTEAYFGRMSIDAAALDLPPPYVALQAVHALQSLLAYPVLLLLLYLLDRAVTARLPGVRSWCSRVVDRLGRVAYLMLNLIVVFPLVRDADTAGSNRALIQTTSALSEVASLMQVVAVALLVYVVWLSVARRAFLLAELRLPRILPLALMAAIIFLGALINTADRARANAERLMTGASDTSLLVHFTMADDRPPPADALVFVTLRNSHYFVVERQPDPPSLTPRAFAVPFRAVDSVEFERVNAAPPSDSGIVITGDWFAPFAGP